MVFDGFIFRQRVIHLNNKYIKIQKTFTPQDSTWCLTTNVIYINSIHFKRHVMLQIQVAMHYITQT